MTFRTILASSRHILPVIAFVAALGIVACSSGPPPAAEMTQLEVRQLQSREYGDTDERTVIKAVIAALQDEGFIISTANPELGLVTAAMELRDEDKLSKAWSKLAYGMGSYQTTRRFEASSTVQKLEKTVRVRINIIVKALANTGGILWSQPLYGEDIYQNIFSKVNKSVFLAKEKL